MDNEMTSTEFKTLLEMILLIAKKSESIEEFIKEIEELDIFKK